MKRLKIDLEELITAFDNASDEMEYYLDTGTGEVIALTDEADSTVRRWRKLIAEDEENRYVPVPALSTPEGYREMMLFIETVEDRELRELLKMATSGRGAFRRFKDVLVRFADERQRWFTFKDGRLRERVEEWLQELGIELDPTAPD